LRCTVAGCAMIVFSSLLESFPRATLTFLYHFSKWSGAHYSTYSRPHLPPGDLALTLTPTEHLFLWKRSDMSSFRIGTPKPSGRPPNARSLSILPCQPLRTIPSLPPVQPRNADPPVHPLGADFVFMYPVGHRSSCSRQLYESARSPAVQQNVDTARVWTFPYL